MNEYHGNRPGVQSFGQPSQSNANTRPEPVATPPGNFKKEKGEKMKRNSKTVKTVFMVMVVALAILLGALVAALISGGKKTDSTAIKDTQYQAIFLSGEDSQTSAQAYFGKLTRVNDSFYKLTDIFYLQVSQQLQPDGKTATDKQQQLQLTPLGCELHGPESAMYINKDKVMFWENLKDEGRVVTAIKKYRQDNPGAQKCDQPSSTSSTSSTETTTTTDTTKKP